MITAEGLKNMWYAQLDTVILSILPVVNTNVVKVPLDFVTYECKQPFQLVNIIRFDPYYTLKLV